MKIVIIHGQSHKGSTYHIAHMLAEKISDDIGVCISTAAGAGIKQTNKDMMDSLFFWGVAKRYKYGVGVAATDWSDDN